ncbi:hypothetical protein [Paractinoplanes globisporus]|uniref:Uncharacterized protein n=1 Tax=Paractinoplanes globisporus TaxID=113565 RepID=A0ABW6WF08_9ACTN|nr:hypothetical protein [Actinoplanes globisporus]
MRWHTRWARLRRRYLSNDPRPPLVKYLPPDWMTYLLWYSRHANTWVLESRDADRLLIIDANTKLGPRELYAAQTWACTRWATIFDDPCYTWLPITVTSRHGWTPMHNPNWRTNPFYHDLHPPRAIDDCCI